MRLIIALILAIVAVALAFKEPPQTYDAKPATSWKGFHASSKKGEIRVDFKAEDGSDDFVFAHRLDLVGDARTRGFAHGALLTKEIIEFTGPKLDKYYADEVLNLDISQFPEPIHTVLRLLQLKGAAAAPQLFKTAMAWVWEQQKPFTPQVIVDEIEGMGEGICFTLNKIPNANCDTAKWTQTILELNMLPELIRMACTAYGAWGKASGTGGLVQLRALDFGGGPFANYTVVAVHRSDPANPSHAFVSVSFPAFVGVITGVAQNGVGVSEKVWMTYDKRSLQPGSYQGLADIYVLRQVLEFAKSKADAEKYMKDAARTWAMWVGVGDFATQSFDLVGYKQSSLEVYTDETAPSMTGQPYLESIAYVDKHPQPTGEGPTGTLPTALQAFYGNITTENSKTIIQYHQTGDLHIASYDFKNNEMLMALGRVNHDGEYRPEGGSDGSVWRAYNRPYLRFNLRDLWLGV